MQDNLAAIMHIIQSIYITENEAILVDGTPQFFPIQNAYDSWNHQPSDFGSNIGSMEHQSTLEARLASTIYDNFYSTGGSKKELNIADPSYFPGFEKSH